MAKRVSPLLCGLPTLLLLLLLLLSVASPSSARLGARSCHGSLFFTTDFRTGTFFLSSGGDPKPFPSFLSISTSVNKGGETLSSYHRLFPVLLNQDEVSPRSLFLGERIRDYHTLFSYYSISFTEKLKKGENPELATGSSSSSSSSASSPALTDYAVEIPEKEIVQTMNINTHPRRSAWLTGSSPQVRSPWTDSLRFPQIADSSHTRSSWTDSLKRSTQTDSSTQKSISTDSSHQSPWSTGSSSQRYPWTDSLRFPWSRSQMSPQTYSQKPSKIDLLRSSLTDSKQSSWADSQRSSITNSQRSSWTDSLRSLIWINSDESTLSTEPKQSSITRDGIHELFPSLSRDEYSDNDGASSWVFTMNELSRIAFSLLLGAACGAIVAGVFSLAWSFFSRESDDYDDEEEKDIGILCSYQLLASPKECEKLNKANFDGAPENKV